jgi:hypothetical protein
MPRSSVHLATVIASLVAILATPATAAILLGQLDDFEGGTLQGWQAGSNNPYGPTNIASGGPSGADDNYLRLASDGSTTAGRLVAFNSEQWTGDYLDAGVSAIQMLVNNLGTTDLVLRLILIGAGSLTTATPIVVAAGSGWNTVSFSLASANLTGSPYSAVMSNVAELNLVHSTNAVGHRSGAPNIVAQLGIDNITAVPEPSTWLLAGLGFALALCRTARTLRRRSQAPGDECRRGVHL